MRKTLFVMNVNGVTRKVPRRFKIPTLVYSTLVVTKKFRKFRLEISVREELRLI